MSTTRVSLIERVTNPDDQEAWEEFFTFYEPLLLRYVRSSNHCRGLSGPDVDDLVQTVLIKLFRKLPEFTLDQSRGRFRTYLYQVTSNSIIDFLRSRSRLPEPQDKVADAVAPTEEVWDSIYLGTMVNQVTAELKAEINPKNPTQWKSFEEQCLKSQPAREVADELGISVDLVYQNSSRLLKRVRQICQSRFQEDLA